MSDEVGADQQGDRQQRQAGDAQRVEPVGGSAAQRAGLGLFLPVDGAQQHDGARHRHEEMRAELTNVFRLAAVSRRAGGRPSTAATSASRRWSSPPPCTI
ncbi:hypothetical protein [Actinomadura miaoliensis]|uniref:hypothetical protein n=1 Tax=Actinomadura miaoliensis TaxID=430685 RepID=UPI0031E9641B